MLRMVQPLHVMVTAFVCMLPRRQESWPQTLL